jgi:Na+/H+ antiporter NhaC
VWVQIKKTIMKKVLLGLLLVVTTNAYSQSDSIRINQIDSTLRVYGKQQSAANKITIVSIATIGIGTILGVPAVPLLIVNTVADLTTLLITSKSNRKLSKHRSK